MLQKSRITDIHMNIGEDQSEKWKRARLGKFTSSRIVEIMGERGIGEMGESYILTRVFEEFSGVSSEREILNESIAHGNAWEWKCLDRFCEAMGIDPDSLNRQVLIKGYNDRFSCTPDGIMNIREGLDRLSHEVKTVEAKCFQALLHMKCCLCKTPQQLKKVHPKTFWQTLDQMNVADCLEGYAVFYHPDLEKTKYCLNIIHFRVMEPVEVNGKISYPLNDDLKFLNSRKAEALKRFEELKN